MKLTAFRVRSVLMRHRYNCKWCMFQMYGLPTRKERIRDLGHDKYIYWSTVDADWLHDILFISKGVLYMPSKEVNNKDYYWIKKKKIYIQNRSK